MTSAKGLARKAVTPAGFGPRELVDAAEAAPVPRLGWREAIHATVSGLGFELVDVERAQRGLLRVTIDRMPGRVYTLADGSPDTGEFIVVEDCEQVTRQLQYALEVEGLDYARLEVSSPGLDRPLRSESDYRRFAGQLVSIMLKQPFEGRKNWQGLLLQAEAPGGQAADSADGADSADRAESAWRLRFKVGKTEQELGFRLSEVREARLVPVLDFKGRRQDPSASPGDVAGTGAGDGPADGPGAALAAAVVGERDE